MLALAAVTPLASLQPGVGASASNLTASKGLGMKFRDLGGGTIYAAGILGLGREPANGARFGVFLDRFLSGRAQPTDVSEAAVEGIVRAAVSIAGMVPRAVAAQWVWDRASRQRRYLLESALHLEAFRRLMDRDDYQSS